MKGYLPTYKGGLTTPGKQSLPSYMHQANRYGDTQNVPQTVPSKVPPLYDSDEALSASRSFLPVGDENERKIKMLENDKINLIKRLNLALIELDRLTQEKVEIASKVREKTRMTEDFERRLGKANNLTNLISKNMQDDITYQKEENKKLKEQIGESEKDKSHILLDLKSQEDAIKIQKFELDEKERNFEAKQKELAEIENQYSQALFDLKQLLDQAESMKSHEALREEQKEELKFNIDTIIEERNDLILRMNDLTEKYERFANTLSEERMEIAQTNSKHTKLLCSSILLSYLSNRIIQQEAIGFENIKKMATFRSIVLRRIKELLKLKAANTKRIKISAFSVWRHTVLQWVPERQINEQFILKRFEKKNKFKFFSQWKANYYQSAEEGNQQIIAASYISKIKLKQGRKRLRELFQKWLKNSLILKRRDWLLKQIITKNVKSLKMESFENWLKLAHQQRQTKKLETLADTLAEAKFKREMFNNFKYNVFKQEDIKIAQAQTSLEDTHIEKAKNRFLKASMLVLLALNKAKQNNLIKEAKESLVFNVLDEKKARAQAHLQEELPIIKANEQELSEITSDFQNKRKENLIKSCLFTFKRRMRYFFEKWRNLPALEKDNWQLLKRILMRWTFNKEQAALMKWLINKRKIDHAEHQNMEHSAKQQVEHLFEENHELDSCLEKNIEHLNKFSVGKIGRIARMISRALMLRRFQAWRLGSHSLASINRGGNRIKKTLRKFALRQAVEKYRKQIQLMREAMSHLYKQKMMNQIIEKNNARRCFREMRRQVRLQKMSKKILQHITRKISKNRLRKYIDRWRTSNHEQFHLSETTENKRLQAEIDHTENIISDENKIQNITNEALDENRKKEHGISTTSHYVNFHIWQCRRVQDAFRIWRQNTHKINRIKSLMLMLVKKNYVYALRDSYIEWRRATFLENIRNINDDLKRRVGKFEAFSRISNLRIGEAEDAYRRLRDTQTQLKNENALDQQKIDKATNILGNLKQYCIQYSITNNCLLAWHSTYLQEKKLQEKVRILSKIFVGKYIYAKLKQFSDSKKTVLQLEKKWTMSCNCLAHILERKALSCFRENAKNNKGINKLSQIQAQDEVLNSKVELIESIKDRANDTYFREIKKRSLLKLLRAWKKETDFSRLLARKSTQLQDSLRVLKLSKSFDKWRGDYTSLEQIEIKTLKAVDSHNMKTLQSIFQAWKKLHFSTVRLPKLLSKISHRKHFNNLIYGIEHLNNVNNKAGQQAQTNQTVSSTRLFYALQKMYNERLSSTLCTLYSISHQSHMNKVLLRTIFIRCFSKNIAKAFSIWRQQANEISLINNIEDKGQSAQEVAQLIRRHKATQQLMKNSNIASPSSTRIRLIPLEEEADEEILQFSRRSARRNNNDSSPQRLFVEERKEIQKKFIKLWMRKLVGYDLVGKYLDNWRSWLTTRNTIQKYADLIQKRLKYKEKSWAFDKMKNIRRAASVIYDQVPRNNLINKIVDHDRDITLLSRDAENLDQNIQMRSKRNQGLKVKYHKGKKIAIGTLQKLLTKTPKKLLSRWRLFSENYMLFELAYLYQEKLMALQNLQKINTDLHSGNTNLMFENEDLRQASLDGIEIASTVQSITRDREQMSTDLASRSLTVKKLIDENEILSQRLSIAEDEAKKLMSLTSS